MQKKTSPSKLIVGDTSALVSLQTGGLLQDAFSIVQLFVPRDVLDELTLHARFDANAAAVLALIRKGNITVCEVQNRRRVDELVTLFPKIEIGEAASDKYSDNIGTEAQDIGSNLRFDTETYQSGFDKLLDLFGNCSTRQLELYATMHFVDSILKKKGKIADAESVISEVKFLKPKYSTDECEAAYQYLAENFGWR